MFDFDDLEDALTAQAPDKDCYSFYAISDVHVEHTKNLQWLRGLPRFPGSVLLVAGDVGISLKQVKEALMLFKERFNHVFYCYGNHEMWCSAASEVENSHRKLEQLRSLCIDLGVHIKATLIGGVWVVPVLGWYHHSWDKEGPLRPPPGRQLAVEPQPPEMLASDAAGCRWAPGLTNGSEDVARTLDAENEAWGSWPLPPTLLAQAARPPGQRLHPIISFSHFLPRQELMPEKRFLFQPNLPKIVGSDWIRRRVDELRPDLHVFGHTHFPWDMTLDGTRYRSWPLGSASEQARRIATYPTELVELWHPLEVFTSAKEHTQKQEVCWFSEMYTRIVREPESCHMASYVAHMYCPGAPIVPPSIISPGVELTDEAMKQRQAKYSELATGSMRKQAGRARRGQEPT